MDNIPHIKPPVGLDRQLKVVEPKLTLSLYFFGSGGFFDVDQYLIVASVSCLPHTEHCLITVMEAKIAPYFYLIKIVAATVWYEFAVVSLVIASGIQAIIMLDKPVLDVLHIIQRVVKSVYNFEFEIIHSVPDHVLQ